MDYLQDYHDEKTLRGLRRREKELNKQIKAYRDVIELLEEQLRLVQEDKARVLQAISWISERRKKSCPKQ